MRGPVLAIALAALALAPGALDEAHSAKCTDATAVTDPKLGELSLT